MIILDSELGFVSDLKSEIDKLATEYISNARTLSSEEKLGLLKQIQEAYGKCKEFGDDKVQLAMQTYEMVRRVWGSIRWLQSEGLKIMTQRFLFLIQGVP